MKIIIWSAILVYSSQILANQEEALSKARDHYIDSAISLLKVCGDELSSRSADATYICRLQLQSDCVIGEGEVKKKACETFANLQKLEKQILDTDKALAQLQKQPMYSSRPITEVAKNKLPQDPQFVTIRYDRLSVSDKAEGKSQLQKIKQTFDTLKLIKVRADCSAAADCKIQEYGHMICGGPDGTFAYSTRGNENAKLIAEINALNTEVLSYQKTYMSLDSGFCVSKGRSDPAECVDNVCR